MARKMSEEQKEKARVRSHEHYERTGGTAQKAYQDRCLKIQVALNPDKDGDLIALFGEGSLSGQTKDLLRELIQLRARCFYPPKNGG